MKEMRSNAHKGAGRQRHRSHAAEQDDHVGKHASGGITATQRIRPEYLHLYRHPTSASLSLAEYYRLQELTEHNEVYNFGGHAPGRHRVCRAGRGDRQHHRDPRRPRATTARARGGGRSTCCQDSHRVRGCVRPIMSEVVAELEWAVTHCKECVVATTGGSQNSSWHAGSNMEMASRSHTRSKMATIVGDS
jgi:hypothetical protein